MGSQTRFLICCKQTDIQTSGLIDRLVDRHTGSHTDRLVDRQAGRHINW